MEHNSLFAQSYMRWLVAILLITGIAALAAYAHLTLKQAKYAFSGPATISVSGTGEILARPDIGTFSFAVRANGEDAAAAQESSAEAINVILAYLDESGVAEKDIKTQNYNLNPRYRYEPVDCPEFGFCPPGEQVIDGYEVSQWVNVKVRDLDTSGELISGVGDRGATNISGLSFTVDDTDTLQADARAAAIADAKAKAKVLADDLGVSVVRMISYWEHDGGFYGPTQYGFAEDMAVMETRAAVAPELPTGESTISSRVDITFEVQ